MQSLDFGAPEALELATRLLREERVVVLPTETLYGFSALAMSERALQHLEGLKNMPRRRSMLALVDRFEGIETFLAPRQDPRGLEFLRQAWPAPLTAVLAVDRALPWGDGEDGNWTAAFRVPAHPRLRALLAKVGAPVVSTSVNRTGAAPAQGQADVVEVFGREPDLVFFRDRGLESSAPRPSSTLLDVSRWPPVVLRTGSFDLQAWLDTRGGWP